MRKDVQLIIRAKDEATKSVNSIATAINSLVTAQKTLGDSGGKADTSITKLGSSLAELDRVFKGLNATDRLSNQFTRAKNATDRLRRSASDAAIEHARLSKAQEQAAFSAEKLKRQTEGAKRAQDAQRQSVKATSDNLKLANQVLKEAVVENDKLTARQTKLATATAKTLTAIDASKKRHAELTTRIAATTGATTRLTQSRDVALNKISQQTAKLEKQREEYRDIEASLATLPGRIAQLSKEQDSAAASSERSSKALDRINRNYKDLNVASKAAERNFKSVDDAADRAAGSLEQANTAVEKSKVEFREFAAAAEQTDAALKELGAASAVSLKTGFDAARISTLKAKRAWAESTAEVKRLSQEMRTGEGATVRIKEAFEKAKISAAFAKQEYIEQRNSLGGLSNIMRQTGGDVQQLRERQEAFTNSLQRTSGNITKIRGEAKQAGAAYGALATQAARGSTNTRRLSGATNAMTGATDKATSATRRLKDAYRNLYGSETRKALSTTQRLRGQVLSLVAAYGGFFGVIRLLSSTVDAFQKLEAANSRLNVVFEGDDFAVTEELDFLRRTANRLGLEFGTLANEYTKFAVATKGTNLEGEKTRKIFLSVAEAARVNKISNEQMGGIFVALTQIVSKGTVQMEELKQQLGDRLPGALQIMADGLDVSTTKLIKMLEAGEVTSDALIGFADTLDERFGPSLGAALRTTTTEIGKFKNAVFLALIQFGEAGFIESFTELLKTMTAELQSAEFATFAEKASAAFGVLVNVLQFAVENINLLIAAAVAFTLVKIIPFIGAIAFGLRGMSRAFRLARIRMLRANATANITVGAFGRASIAVRAFSIALASSGIGLAIIAISAATALWLGGASDLNEVLFDSLEIIDKVKDAEEKLIRSTLDNADAIDQFKDSLSKLSLAEATDDLQKLQKETDKLRKSLVDTLGKVILFNDTPLIGQDLTLEQIQSLAVLVTEFVEGKIALDEFTESLDDMVAADDGVAKVAAELIDVGKALENAAGQATELQAKLLAIADPEAAARLALVAASLRGPSDPNAKGEVDKEITKEEEKRLKAIKAFREQQKQNIADAEFELSIRGKGIIQQEVEKAQRTALLKAQKLKITLTEDELLAIKRVTTALFAQRAQEKSISDRAKATNKLLQIRGDLTDKLEIFQATGNLEAAAETKAALEDINDELKASLASAIGMWQAIGGPDAEAAISTLEAAALAAENFVIDEKTKKSTEAIKAFREEQAQAIKDSQFELSIRDKGIIQQETAIRLREAELEARKLGTELSLDEIKAIEDTTAALFKQQAIEDAIAASKKKAADADERVSQLTSQRSALVEQLQIFRDTGDKAKAEETTGLLQGINTELKLAIANAIAMWTAIGGPEADVAIAQLEVAALKALTFGQAAKVVYVDWTRVKELFATGLTNAFDGLAEAIAQGKNVLDSAKTAFLQFAADFLRQIAQMIIKQAILNAIMGFFGGGSLVGKAATAIVGTGHTGGVVGSSGIGSGNASRRVSSSIFATAAKFHDGGIVGLRPGEVPAVLLKNEEVLSRDDPRNALNGGGIGGGAGQTPVNLKNINLFEGSDVLESTLSTRVGEQVVLNYVRENPDAFKAALAGG
jgi:tape measure domain-containing protein